VSDVRWACTEAAPGLGDSRVQGQHWCRARGLELLGTQGPDGLLGAGRWRARVQGGTDGNGVQRPSDGEVGREGVSGGGVEGGWQCL
jgi:hypothetical protein